MNIIYNIFTRRMKISYRTLKKKQRKNRIFDLELLWHLFAVRASLQFQFFFRLSEKNDYFYSLLNVKDKFSNRNRRRS